VNAVAALTRAIEWSSMAKATLRYNTTAFRLPPELERRLKQLALPPDVARQLRAKLAVSPDLMQRLRLDLSVGEDISPELVQVVEEATATAVASPVVQEAAVTERIATKAWFTDAHKNNPKHKGETDSDWAKRLHGLMKNSPVTVLWSEATCRRRLYR
jgi:hypothetical protein